jgi:hypothetical protein
MVLLTSSTVSVMLSSGVVCMFTFLLFLSGYVLQQQSVRSIQDAIRRPPEPKPTPTLPAQFQRPENDTIGMVLERPGGSVEAVVGEGQSTGSEQLPIQIQRPADDQQLQRLAYIFALEEPAHLCSALLFAKDQREASRLPKPPAIIFLYPSTWETSSSVLFTTTLNFMRDVQELYDVIYHPVQIHKAWNTKSLLLGDLQYGRWDYDQMLYLRSPGMLLNGKALDAVLSSSDTRQAWAPLNPSSGDDPEILLRTSRGLQSPRGPARRLVLSTTHDADGDDNPQEGAAYILFDNEQDDIPAQWHSEFFDQHKAGTETVCAGNGLLDIGL